MAESVLIRIRNFEQYKGRKEVKHNSWFRCSNRILEDHEFFDFTHEELLVWVYLLALSSQKNTGDVHVSYQHAHHVCRLSENSVTSAIEKLCKIKVIERVRVRSARGRYAHDTQTCSTNITDITNKTEQLPVLTDAAVNPITFYCDLWKEKNGKSPDIRPKEAGQITKLVKDVGLKRACEIMRAYFSMPDPLFIRRGYDVGTMLLSLNAIAQFESNGKIVTKLAVEQIEKQVDKIQGTKRRRSIEELEAERDQQIRIASGGENDN